MTRVFFLGRRYVYRTVLISAAAVLVCLSAQPVFAQAGGEKPSTNSSARIKFRPPSTGAPSVRLTGGSRGTGDSRVTLDVLAPDDIGLTTQEQPSLFWYQSKPASARFELTLLQENQVKPLLEFKGERALHSGINRLRLSEHGVKLSPGVEYQWVVALILDPDNRSNDLVATGVIKRVPASADLKSRLAGATPQTVPAAYAEAGIWYDALSHLSDQIEADPGNQALQEARADLLRQAGLKATANPTVAATK